LTDTFILNLETSAKDCSIALGKNGECLGTRKSKGEWKHSREITLLIEQTIKDAGLKFDQLSAVAVSSGPGSYTGLRVGTSAAKAMAFALEIPLLAVETLKLIAAPYHKQALEEKSIIIPVIDARRDEVYYQLYDAELNALNNASNLVLKSDSLEELACKKNIICGDAAVKAERIIGSTAFSYEDSRPDAYWMCSLSQDRLDNNYIEDTAYFRPFYLKSPNITKSKKAPF
jgi:tRNA threonylcarbamoyladenosine biosynthesis protein TsaB